MSVYGAIAHEFSAIPKVIPIVPKVGSMIRGLPFEDVLDAEPFFISRRWIIPRKSKRGNVLRKSATSLMNADPPPRDKWAQSRIYHASLDGSEYDDCSESRRTRILSRSAVTKVALVEFFREPAPYLSGLCP